MDDEDVLSDRLAKVASGGDSAKAVAKIVCKLMSTKSLEQAFSVNLGAAAAKRSCFQAMNEIGDVLEGADNPEGAPRISAVINSGFLSMNPCIVHLTVVAENEGTSTVLILAKAKEGIIKQGTAQKAVSKFLTQLRQIVPANDVPVLDPVASPMMLGR